MDSLLIVDMLQNRKKQNAKMRKIIKEIIQILDQNRVKVSHYYREANQVADALAKHATTLDNATFYERLQQLPGVAKGPFQLDKWKLPSFRSRYDKGQFFCKLNIESSGVLLSIGSTPFLNNGLVHHSCVVFCCNSKVSA